MLTRAAVVLSGLDATTLVVAGTCVTALLGFVLLFVWLQDRIRALAWWGAAYLVGGSSVAIWSVEDLVSPPLPPGSASALLFVACGMMWSAARLFHGRPVLWGEMAAGAAVWLAVSMIPGFRDAGIAQVVLASMIVAIYTFLTAAELWRERRRNLIRRWPALFVPILHGLVFLMPIPLAALLPREGGVATLASGWAAVFGLEVMLYAVGAAFIVLVLSKERAVRQHRTAAETDALTGLYNRRGFLLAAEQLMSVARRRGEAVSVLMCDLDHFKTINDACGHATGDKALRLFAGTLTGTLRIDDVIGRIGGEEFAVVLRGGLADGCAAAERLRGAFEAAGHAINGHAVDATASIGVACGSADTDILVLLAQADDALYRAKRSGRNRIETIGIAAPPLVPEPGAGVDDALVPDVRPETA